MIEDMMERRKGESKVVQAPIVCASLHFAPPPPLICLLCRRPNQKQSAARAWSVLIWPTRCPSEDEPSSHLSPQTSQADINVPTNQPSTGRYLASCSYVSPSSTFTAVLVFLTPTSPLMCLCTSRQAEDSFLRSQEGDKRESTSSRGPRALKAKAVWESARQDIVTRHETMAMTESGRVESRYSDSDTPALALCLGVWEPASYRDVSIIVSLSLPCRSRAFATVTQKRRRESGEATPRPCSMVVLCDEQRRKDEENRSRGRQHGVRDKDGLGDELLERPTSTAACAL